MCAHACNFADRCEVMIFYSAIQSTRLAIGASCFVQTIDTET